MDASLLVQAKQLVLGLEKLKAAFVKTMPPADKREVIHHKTYVEFEDLIQRAQRHVKTLAALGASVAETRDMLRGLIDKEGSL